MNWFEAMKLIENGGEVISSRLQDGCYITGSTTSEGGLILVLRNGSFAPWRPSGADQLSESWELKDN